ncbi:MAG: thiamine-phosphate kinase [Candidatus Caldarchaeales archaeon]
MKKLRDLGERSLIKYINSTLKRFPGSILPVGDDAVDMLIQGRFLVSVDMMVQSTDIPEGVGWRVVGYRAVTSTTSDIAAKGGRPKAYLISMALPPNMDEEDFKDLWSGILEAVEQYGGIVVGGDTNEGDQVLIDVICIGEVPGKLITRSGAKPGDIVAVTGLFGVEAAGLHALINKVKNDVSRRVVDKMLKPVARVREGEVLSKLATSSIDSSDGLAESLFLLGESSNVGFRIDNPPIDPLAEEYSRECRVDLLELVFFGGEEYELVVTISPENWDKACKDIEDLGGRLIKIGHVIDAPNIVEVLWNDEYIRLPRRGYAHFTDRALPR